MRRLAAVLLILLFLAGSGCRPPEDGKIRIRVIGWGDTEERRIISDTISDWEKDHPEIVVTLEHATYGEYVQKILPQVAAGAGPDVIFSDITYFYAFRSYDMFMDLTPFVNSTHPPFTDRFFPEIIQAFSYDGKIYCIPRDIAPITCIYYNKALFDEAGVPYPTDDWNWDTFLDYSRRLTKRDPSNPDHRLRYGVFVWEWPNFVFSNGGRIVDDEQKPTRCVLDTPEAREAIQFYYDLIHKEKVMPSPQQLASSGMNTEQYFVNEKVAMFLSGIWVTPQLKKLSRERKQRGEKPFEWDIVQFPKGPKGLRGTRTGGAGYGILKTTKYPKEAWEVVKALAGAKGQTDLATSGLAQPADRTIAESPVWAGKQNIPSNRGTLNDAVKHVVFDPNHRSWFFIMSNYVNYQMELYLTQRQDLDTTIKNIVSDVTEALKKQ